jgi:hypothetical protein
VKRVKGRNHIAIQAHFRKAGPMKDKKKELPRERKYKEEVIDEKKEE